MVKPKVIVVLGLTASGKSALGVMLAKKWNGEIISADSRQVYQGLDIGTGKISKKEMKGVPHHLLDVAKPKNKFTVAQFQKLADGAIKEIIAKGKVPIICGGTGFYIDAVVKGEIYPPVAPNQKLRKELSKKTAESLFKMLSKLDPVRAKSIDAKNKVRLIRAIEVAKALGKVPRIKKVQPKYEFIKIGLTLPTDELNTKIERRVKKMFKNGLLKEIALLKKSGVSQKRLAEFGFEYNSPTIASVVDGSIKYAKRQMTWFKRDQEIKWFTLSNRDEYKKIEKYLRSRIRIL